MKFPGEDALASWAGRKMSAAAWAKLFILLNAVDAAMTAWAIRVGQGEVREVNVIAAALLSRGIWVFFAAKVTIGCWLAWYSWRKRSTTTVLGSFFIGVVICWNLFVVGRMLLA